MSYPADLIGKTVVDVRRLSPEEVEAWAWKGSPHLATAAVVVLDDGTVLLPSADAEGNDPGALFRVWDDGGTDLVALRDPKGKS